MRPANGTRLGLAVVIWLALPAGSAQAADPECTVTSLKQAIVDANGTPEPDTIHLPASCTYTFTTVDNGANALPVVNSAIAIDGNGATLRRDPAAPPMRFLQVVGPGALTLDELTLTGGSVAAIGSFGGAVLANVGTTLTVRRSTVAFNGAGNGGGGIFSFGNSLTVEDSLFEGNAATQGGAVGIGGGGGTATNATFVGNRAEAPAIDGGGAVLVEPGIPFTLRNSTVAGNSSAAGGGGVRGVVLENTILASNTPDNCGAPIIDGLHNLSFPPSDTSCNTVVGGPGVYVTGDPRLGPLQDNGGPTKTLMPGAGSAALDLVPALGAECPAADQRGLPRPFGAACDIGAVEVASPVATTGGADAVTGDAATLRGSAGNPALLAGSSRFEYGKTTAYGNTAAVAPVGAGENGVERSARVTGLESGTTYHFRLVVETADGVAVGADATFTTAVPPGGPPPRVEPPPPPPLLCNRAIVLTDVTPIGRRVRLGGIARVGYAGQRVEIRARGRVVARATVRSDGTFQTSARRPRGRRAARARYTASVAGQSSPALKLTRGLVLTGQRRVGNRVRVTGRLTKARGVRRRLTIDRHTGCTSAEISRVATVRTRRNGRFSVTLDPPAERDTLAVYRVRAIRPTTFTLPIVLRDGR